MKKPQIQKRHKAPRFGRKAKTITAFVAAALLSIAAIKALEVAKQISSMRFLRLSEKQVEQINIGNPYIIKNIFPAMTKTKTDSLVVFKNKVNKALPEINKTSLIDIIALSYGGRIRSLMSQKGLTKQQAAKTIFERGNQLNLEIQKAADISGFSGLNQPIILKKMAEFFEIQRELEIYNAFEEDSLSEHIIFADLDPRQSFK